MTAADVTPLRWTTREPPLPCAAVAGHGPARADLWAGAARRIEQGQALRAVADGDWIVLLGDDLPWADGAIYLGWDGGLLVPTSSAPNVPADLLRRTLGERPDQLTIVLPGAVLSSPTPLGTADLRAGP